MSEATIDIDKYSKSIAFRKLREFLRKLGIRSIRSEIEYSLLEMMENTGSPDQIFLSPYSMKTLKKALLKNED